MSNPRRNEARRSTAEIVSARMSAVRQRHTAPELAVRRLVYSLGARYRVCSTGLPGRPDLTNMTKAWCIFVHGCFWHGHDCKRGRLPKTNLRFWRPKIQRNRIRDAIVLEQLRARRYHVLIVWQCELAEPSRLRARVRRFLGVASKRSQR
jgi:DNA mismatch endonuclease (patch repair protein)